MIPVMAKNERRREQQTTRHATRSGSGANEPKDSERKQEAGWISRQGGDQTRDAGPRPERRQEDGR